jgi:hypothetical protein
MRKGGGACSGFGDDVLLEGILRRGFAFDGACHGAEDIAQVDLHGDRAGFVRLKKDVGGFGAFDESGYGLEDGIILEGQIFHGRIARNFHAEDAFAQFT